MGSMKTAISIEDGLLREAAAAARSLGVSRSRLFAVALDSFLRNQRRETMLRQLNEVYGGKADPSEKALRGRMKEKLHATLKDRW